jgi:hypothetical protein
MKTAAIGAQRPKSRSGCLGCLSQVVVVLLLGSILVLAIPAVFSPWAFFLGGKFHILPYWQGSGRMHSPLSGDYVLFVRLEPGGLTRLGNAYLTGVGYICTPRKEQIRLTLAGTMGKHLKLTTEGEAIGLHLYRRPWFSSVPLQRRPRIDLSGHWQNPNLVMDDKGSISVSFLPDGRVNLGSLPAARENIPITMVEGSWSDFENACAANH